MNAPPFDAERAHRWFAVEFNNEAWELCEKPSRAPEETARMIHLAHAAALHWAVVGKPINTLRAEQLLASAYLAAGELSIARRHMERCLTLVSQNLPDETAFDRAFAAACARTIYLATEEQDQADKHAAIAAAELTTLDDDDRRVVETLYG
jgi:hypothetical protein